MLKKITSLSLIFIINKTKIMYSSQDGCKMRCDDVKFSTSLVDIQLFFAVY